MTIYLFRSLDSASRAGKKLPSQSQSPSGNGSQPAVLTSRGGEVRAYSPGAARPSPPGRLPADGAMPHQVPLSATAPDGQHQPVHVIPTQPIMPGNLPPGQYRKLPSGQIVRLVPVKKPVKKNSHSKRYEMKHTSVKKQGPAGTTLHQGVFKKNIPMTAIANYGTYPPRPARVVASAQGGRIQSSSSMRIARDHGWNTLTLLDKTST